MNYNLCNNIIQCRYQPRIEQLKCQDISNKKCSCNLQWCVVQQYTSSVTSRDTKWH